MGKVSGQLNTFKLRCVSVLCMLFLCGVFQVRAADIRSVQEYEIKAVFLYNFILFSTWPDFDSNKKTITLGIIGDDVFENSFSAVEDKWVKAKKRYLKIKKFGNYTGKENLKECDLLFITREEEANQRQIINKLKGYSVLTVSDTKNFIENGGMINFIKTGKKIRWEINDRAVKESRIRVSSQLYRNAVRVINVGEKEKM